MQEVISIGFIGYSYDNKFDYNRAKKIIEDIFYVIGNKYCTQDNLEIKLNIVSGATNQGIPRLVYEEARKYNAQYGEWFTIVGIMPFEGYNYELYHCDEIYVFGDKFGDESRSFINGIDVLYKIGGGEQSDKELKMAKEKKMQVFEYDL